MTCHNIRIAIHRTGFWFCLLAFMIGLRDPGRVSAQTPDSGAQKDPEPTFAPQDIAYRGRVPAAVWQYVPKSAATYFYGEFSTPDEYGEYSWPDGYAKSDRHVAILLFNPFPKQRPDSKYSASYHLTLLVFDVGSGKPELINYVPLSYNSSLACFDALPQAVGAQLLWLNPGDHVQPILKFHCYVTPGYFGGDFGDEVVALFPDGLAGIAFVNSFDDGSWKASDSCGANLDVQHVGQDGLLELRYTLYLVDALTGGPHTTVYHWNDKSFQWVAESTSKAAAVPDPD